MENNGRMRQVGMNEKNKQTNKKTSGSTCVSISGSSEICWKFLLSISILDPCREACRDAPRDIARDGGGIRRPVVSEY